MTFLTNCEVNNSEGLCWEIEGRWRSLTNTLICICCKWFTMSCWKSMRGEGDLHAAQGNRISELSCSFLNEIMEW